MGWSPETFWKSTVNEFLQYGQGVKEMIARQKIGDAMSQEEFDELSARFPDEKR